MSLITKENPAWVRSGRNSLLKGDGFYISYNPASPSHDADYWNDLNNLFNEDHVVDRTHTALHMIEDDIWLVLEGDFRLAYSDAFGGGLMECIKVYNRNKEDHRSNWSTD